MALDDLVERLTRALSARSNLTADELADTVNRDAVLVTKREVNATLYGAKSVFRRRDGRPPTWSLVHPPNHSAPHPPQPGPGLDPPTPSSSQPPVSATTLYAWQIEALEAWRLRGRKGVIEAVTGTGKTRVGLAAVTDALAHYAKALVLVPTVELQRQWTSELRKALPAARIGRIGNGETSTWVGTHIIVAIVNSLRTQQLRHPGPGALLVADECHRYGSEANARALDDRFEQRLGLSATYARSDDGNDQYLDPYFGETVFRMDYRRAIAEDVTAHFKVALIAVPFAPGDRIRYDEANTETYTAQRWLIEEGWIPEEPFGELMKAASTLAEGGHGEATWKARRFLQHFAERRRILAESPTKSEVLGQLVPAFHAADRSIVFTQTIESAESAIRDLRQHGLEGEALHSGMKADERRRVLARFSQGKLPVIAAPQVLDEGIDVPAADLAVIVASSRTRRQMIQRMGRVLRRKSDGRLARFAILYTAGSSEDPGRGAHGTFLEEVTEASDDVRDFPVSASIEEITSYLSAYGREKSSPPVAPRAKAATGRPAARPEEEPEHTQDPTRASASPVDNAETISLCKLYRRRHGERWYRRFGIEVETLLRRLLTEANLPYSAVERAIKRSHDPREIEHLARINAKARKSVEDERQAPGPAPSPTRNPGRDQPRPRPTLTQPFPVAPQPPAVRPRRYCLACGLLEENCRCGR